MIESIYIDIFGAFGLVMLLGAFIINHLKGIPRRTFIYNGLNFLGSGILTLYAYHIGSNVFMILNIFWVLISGYFVLDIYHKRHIKKIEKAPKRKK
jgi:membrane glycosyltransferase